MSLTVKVSPLIYEGLFTLDEDILRLQKAPDDSTSDFGVFEDAVVACSINDLHLTITDMRMHKLCIRKRCDGILAAADNQRRHRDGLQRWHGIRALCHSTLYRSDILQPHGVHQRASSRHNVRPIPARGFAKQVLHLSVQEARRSMLPNFFDRFQATRARLMGISSCSRVRQHQGSYLVTMSAPEFKEDVPGNRDSNEGSQPNGFRFKELRQVFGVLGHSR